MNSELKRSRECDCTSFIRNNIDKFCLDGIDTCIVGFTVQCREGRECDNKGKLDELAN